MPPGFEFTIIASEKVTDAQTALMSAWDGKDGKTLVQAVLHPSGEFRSGEKTSGHPFFNAGWCPGAVGTIQDGAKGDWDALIQTRHIGPGILLQMQLALLPAFGFQRLE